MANGICAVDMTNATMRAERFIDHFMKGEYVEAKKCLYDVANAVINQEYSVSLAALPIGRPAVLGFFNQLVRLTKARFAHPPPVRIEPGKTICEKLGASEVQPDGAIHQRIAHYTDAEFRLRMATIPDESKLDAIYGEILMNTWGDTAVTDQSIFEQTLAGYVLTHAGHIQGQCQFIMFGLGRQLFPNMAAVEAAKTLVSTRADALKESEILMLCTPLVERYLALDDQPRFVI